MHAIHFAHLSATLQRIEALHLMEQALYMQVAKEVDQHTDIVFVNHKTNYNSILFKTYYVLEYAVTNYDVKFVLKTDDDAFINIDPLMSQLHLLCITEECRNERIYMGRMAKESEVLLQPGHKWNNIIFHNHTGRPVMQQRHTLTSPLLCMTTLLHCFMCLMHAEAHVI